MPVILNNLRTTHVDKRTIERLWPEVANVNQEYACALRESPTTGGEGTLGVSGQAYIQRDRTDEPRDSQLRLDV